MSCRRRGHRDGHILSKFLKESTRVFGKVGRLVPYSYRVEGDIVDEGERSPRIYALREINLSS